MKVFQMPFGHSTNATAEAQLHTEVREQARTVDIVPVLKHNLLLSISKFVEANYITVFTAYKVQIFDGEKATITKLQAQQSLSSKGRRTNKQGFGGY